MSRRDLAWTAVFFVAVTLLLAYPFSMQLAHHVATPGTDTDLPIWTVAWDVHAMTHQPWHIFDANIFFPFKNTLAYSENSIGAAILAAPIIWLTHNPVLAVNVVALASAPLCGLGAFMLARTLGLSRQAAVLCAVIYAFAPARFLRLEQFHVNNTEWIPFALAFLHRYFAHDRPRDLRIAAALFSWQALTSGHGAAMLTVAIVIVIAWRLYWGMPAALTRRLRDLGWQGALCFAPIILIYLPYRAAGKEVGLNRALDDWSVNTVSFFSSPSRVDQFLIGLAPRWEWISQSPDAWLFPGVLPIALCAAAAWTYTRAPRSETPNYAWRCMAALLEVLAIVWFALCLWVAATGGVKLHVTATLTLTSHGATPWLQWLVLVALRAALLRKAPLALGERSRARLRALQHWLGALNTSDAMWLYGAIVLISFWMAIGPPFGIWRAVYWLPGLTFIRVPSRFIVLGILALGVMAACGFDRITARMQSGARTALAAVVIAACLCEFWTGPLIGVPYALEIPAIDRWVGTQPEPMAILEAPLSDSQNVVYREEQTTRYMLHSMAHWKPIFQGWSGIEPRGYQINYSKLIGFPSEESIAAMKALGLTHTILHMDLVPEVERAATEARLAQFSDRVHLVHVEGEGRLYSVK